MANELHTERILGVSAADSDALLADLFDVLYDDTNTYSHSWAVGDLVLWDNVALHHGRRDFPRTEARPLQRVTLGLYTPAEAVPGLAGLLAASNACP
jgi:taurine dioxygenase